MSLQLAAGAGATSVAASVPGEVFDTASTCFTIKFTIWGTQKILGDYYYIVGGEMLGNYEKAYLA